eukprot:g3918.t1
MFEKFPQLWRLERMISKAQTKDSSYQGFSEVESISPCLNNSREVLRRKIKPDVVDDNTGAFEKQTERQNQMLNLYDSDDLTGFKKPATKSNTKGKNKELSQSKTRRPHFSTTCIKEKSLPNHVKRVTFRESRKDRTMQLSNLRPEEKKILLRIMEDFKPSDCLNVLSDEETEESHFESSRHCRYPLPTMPLSIMMPHPVMSMDLFPLNANSVSEKIAGYDDSIGKLMKIRNRLSSCFELFDDLCTSFHGPQNLDCFLRSMMSGNSSQALKKEENYQSDVIIDSQSVTKQTKKKLFDSNPSEKSLKNEDLSFSGSRLLRPTISTRMKYVITKNKETTSNDVDPPKKLPKQTRKPKKSKLIPLGSCTGTACLLKSSSVVDVVPSSEKDAREDMMSRVRRHLMRMPWIGKSKRNSLNKVVNL